MKLIWAYFNNGACNGIKSVIVGKPQKFVQIRVAENWDYFEKQRNYFINFHL